MSPSRYARTLVGWSEAEDTDLGAGPVAPPSPSTNGNGHVDGSVVGRELVFAQSANGAHRVDAADYFRRAVEEGRPWAPSLLEAVGLWTLPREVFRDRLFVYLIDGEAFDWLVLAERLLLEAPDAVPADEQERLLFYSELPPEITPAQFKEALGPVKHRAHLNFFYGVVVEEALMLAAEHEVTKARHVRGLGHHGDVDDLVSQRLYGETQASLLRRFQRTHDARVTVHLSLAESKAFTYWLFKRRIKHSDQARIASDTRKGLKLLRSLRSEASIDLCSACLPLPEVG